MAENGEGQRFEGWHQPSEKKTLTDVQVDQLKGLEKVYVAGNRAESFLGRLNVFRRSTKPEPREMISTRALRRFVRETAAENQVSPWDITQQIRSLGIEDKQGLSEIEKRYKERIVYVSDVHEGDEKFYAKLEKLVDEKPEQVMFVGDVIGTSEFGALQKIFYEYVNNHTRNDLKLHETDGIPDETILAYTGKKQPEEDFTLKKGFLKLREAELQLNGESAQAIRKHLDQLTDGKIASEIRRYASYEHYGHYASNLPDKTKKVLAAGLKKNAERLVAVIKRMQEGGSRVHIIEGNWDESSPIDFVPGRAEVVPVDDDKRLFNPKTFFEQHNISFHDSLDTVETETSLQVLLPFAVQRYYEHVPVEDKKRMLDAVSKARAEHKTVIVLGHGQPDWQIHQLQTPDAKPSGVNAEIITGFTKALAEIQPDEIVYGHLHNPITDESGKPVSHDAKYALGVKNGTVAVIPHTSEFSDRSIVASYLPIREVGEVSISRVDPKQKIRGFGGNREPVRTK